MIRHRARNKILSLHDSTGNKVEGQAIITRELLDFYMAYWALNLIKEEMLNGY